MLIVQIDYFVQFLVLLRNLLSLSTDTAIGSLSVIQQRNGGMSSNAVGMLLRLPDAPPTFWQQKENGNKMEKTTKLQKFRGVILYPRNIMQPEQIQKQNLDKLHRNIQSYKSSKG